MISPGSRAVVAPLATLPRAARIDTLRELLRQRDVLPPQSTRPSISSGWPGLDALLPERGLLRGGLTEVVGAAGSGKVTLVARAAAALLSRGAPVAWVSGRGPLYAPALLGLQLPVPHLLQVCPADPARAAWAAEQVLRSDTFALVLLDAVHPSGHPAVDDAGFRRLAGAARGACGALVLLLEPDARLQAVPRSPDLRLGVRSLPVRPPVLQAPAVAPAKPSQAQATPPPAGHSPARPTPTVRRTHRVEVTLLHGRGLPPGRRVVVDLTPRPP